MDPINYIKVKTIGIKHSHSNLFEHSYNLYLLLQHMNCPKYVCLAGLYHSIYGNQYFKPQFAVKRSFIKKTIGVKAEALVHKFNNTDNRDEYFLKHANKYKDLFLICYVNLLDQSQGHDDLLNRYVEKYKEINKKFKISKHVDVIDNLLDQADYNNLSSAVLDQGFPWYFSASKVEDNYPQFVHTFVYNSAVTSDYIKYLDPIFKKLNAKRLFRVKLNYTSKTSKIINYAFHQDVNIACKTAVYYINTNNGYTRIKDGKDIESKANRIAIFNSSLEHAGSSCTDENYRIILNINYL
tara:strand:- start:3350 stop:4237 length:888 start_codon:yes stop_codon:yes gene_type:complete